MFLSVSFFLTCTARSRLADWGCRGAPRPSLHLPSLLFQVGVGRAQTNPPSVLGGGSKWSRPAHGTSFGARASCRAWTKATLGATPPSSLPGFDIVGDLHRLQKRLPFTEVPRQRKRSILSSGMHLVWTYVQNKKPQIMNPHRFVVRIPRGL